LHDHASSLQDQFQPLLERDKLDDLTRMFALLSRVRDTLVRLRDIFENHVKEEGLIAIKKAVAAISEGGSGSIAATPVEDGTPVGKRKVFFIVLANNLVYFWFYF
jgi:cullin 1